MSDPATQSSYARDRYWLSYAIELSRRSPPSSTAFSVGAVLVDADGKEVAYGWSRETDPQVHAEESALGKLCKLDPRLHEATMYTSLEPCSIRKSRSLTCTQLILEGGIPRVVFAWREPELFVKGRGAEELREAGIQVVELADLAERAREVNAHLPGIGEVSNHRG